MDPDRILSHRPKRLSQTQREDYFSKGYILLEAIIPAAQVETLLGTTAGFVERSRAVTKSDTVFDIDKGHTAETPRLRRLSSPSTSTRPTGSSPPAA
jgi:hypothetical protein